MPVRKSDTAAVLAGGAAVAAAMLGLGVAHADDRVDDPISLLDTANTNMTDALNLLNTMPDTVVVNVGEPPAEMFAQFEAIQQPLLSSDDSSFSYLGNLLFGGPDQQLEQASGSFLTAAQGVAADPSSLSADDALFSATLQYLDATLIDSVLPNAVGKLVDQLFDVGGFDTAGSGAADVVGGVGADLAAGVDLPF